MQPPSCSPGREKITCVLAFPPPFSVSTSWLPSPGRTAAAGGSGRALSGAPRAKSCSLTEMMSAKSVPTSSSTTTCSGTKPSLRTVS